MAEHLVRVIDVHYTYGTSSATPLAALRGVGLTIGRGEYLAIIGHNGSGKSTLAKCLNGLLIPTQGEVWVEDVSTREPEHLYHIRASVGMVFQNPDNQFVASAVEDEVAFGPENLGVPMPELAQRVEQALRLTGLEALRGRDPRWLSAGQKARLAVAGILAMRPACLILDESTALLDPLARRDMLALLRRLHAEGLAIVLITHFMDEVVDAQRLVVLEQGRIALQGAPREVLAQGERLEALGLGLPTAAAIAHGLRRRGLPLEGVPLTSEELVRAVTHLQRVRI